MRQVLIVSAIGLMMGMLNQAPLKAQPSDTLVLLYTGGAFGYFEACPCSKANLGGLARRMTIILQTRAASGEKMLLVDVGNQFSTYPKSQAEAELIAAILAEMRYSALNLAEYDFTYGRSFMQSVLAQLPLVSVNLRNAAGQPLAPPYRLFRLGAVRIAVLGLLTESAFANAQDSVKPELQLQPALPALADAVRALHTEDPDIIVLLLRTQDIGLEKALAERFPELSVIVTNSEEFMAPTLAKVGSAVVLSAGHDGEYIGRCTLIVSGKRIVKADNTLIALSPKVPNEPKMHERIQAFKQLQKRKHTSTK